MKPVLPIALTCLLLAGCSVAPGGKHWWSPGTWFSASELGAKQKAEKNEAKAEAKVDTKEAATVHAAHVEFRKLDLTLSRTPLKLDLAQRFSRNGLGLLGQVDTFTAAEVDDMSKVVDGFHSADAKLREAAEKRQREVEGENDRLSRDLEAARRKLDEAQAANRTADAKLAAAFLRENALADELRNERVVKWAAIGGVVLLAGLALYLRIGLGSVGEALHWLPKAIGEAPAKQVVDLLDTSTDRLHQALIRRGRRREQRKAAIA